MTKPKEALPQPVDAARGAAAFQRLSDRLRAISKTDWKIINVDVLEAAMVAIGVAARVNAKRLRVRFDTIGGSEFDIANVRDLEDVAWAAWQATKVLDSLRATGDATLPAALVKRATEVEARMQKCCEYYFADDPVLADELARLRPGTGHRDLAGDLIGYADIYESRFEIVSQDMKYYRPTDLADARKIAKQIVDLLSASLTTEARAAAADQVRAWTLLRQVYGEVRAAGLFIERHDPTSAERYPSLYAATRAPATRKKKAAPEGPGKPPTG